MMKAMLLNPIRKFALFLFALCLSINAGYAQDALLTDEQMTAINAQVEELKTLLVLTEEQDAVVTPILTDSFVGRVGIMEKYGVNPNSPDFKRPKMSTARKLRGEMDALGKDTHKQLSVHLSDEQLETWETLEEERRNKMRNQMRGK